MTDRVAIIAGHLARHFQPGLKVLEIGAGDGLVAERLQRLTRIEMRLVDLVDYNQSELQLEVYDGMKLPFADGSFDYCLLTFVLHHTPDPASVLCEALRVARCGAIVVENEVAGRLRQRVTRLVDSIPHWRHGVPVCYHTLTLEEWCDLFETLPVRAELLARFSLDGILEGFWQNFVMRLEKVESEKLKVKS